MEGGVVEEEEVEGEVEEEPVVRKGGRAGRMASKAANQKIAKNIQELSNLNKKKRRPTEMSGNKASKV